MRPAFRIVVAGRDVTDAVEDGLVSLTATDQAGIDADECTIVFTDARKRVRLPRRGQTLAVALGYWKGLEKQLVAVGSYSICAASLAGNPRQISITARAADTTGRLTERVTRSWDATLGEIVAALAERHGLTPVVSKELEGVTPGHLDQVEESDLNFLTRLAKDHGATVKVQETRLIMVPKGRATTAAGQALPAAAINASETDDWTFDIEDRDAATEARAWWQDPATGQRTAVTVGAPSDAKRLNVPGTKATEAEARTAAKAALEAARRGNLKASCRIPGRPEITAEAPAALTGFDEDMDGQWIVQKATHELSGGTFITALEFAPPHPA